MGAADERPALCSRGIGRASRAVTCRVASGGGAARHGAAGRWGRGSRRGYLPNVPETVCAMLATASLGAVWSSCSPEFGAKGSRPLRPYPAEGAVRGRGLSLQRPLRRGPRALARGVAAPVGTRAGMSAVSYAGFGGREDPLDFARMPFAPDGGPGSVL